MAKVILEHRVLEASDNPLDVVILRVFGRPIGIASSPRYKRPRWPFTPRSWSCYRVVDSISGPVDLLAIPERTVRLKVVGEGHKEKAGKSLRYLLKPQSGTKRPVFRDLHGLIDIDRMRARGLLKGKASINLGELTVDVLVVGAGLSGLSAALAAMHKGLKVLVIDEKEAPGGVLSYVATPSEANPSITSRDLVDRLYAEALGAGVKFWFDSVYLGRLGKRTHLVAKRGGLYVVKAKAVIYAMGGIEIRPIFTNNDIPEVVSSEYALRLITKYNYRPKRVAVIGWDSWALRVAGLVAQTGSNVTIIAKAPLDKGFYYRYAAEQGVELVMDRIETVKRESDGVRIDFTTYESLKEVDLIISTVGYSPDIAPLIAAGTPVRFSVSKLQYIPQYTGRMKAAEGIYVVGASAAMYSERAALLSGRIAGLSAAKDAGAPVMEADIDIEALELYRVSDAADTLAEQRQAETPIVVEDPPTFMATEPGPNQFVDTCMDVTVLMLRDIVNSGLYTLEDAIAYTGLGEGPDQGRESILNALFVLSMLSNKPINEVGKPSFAMPVSPIIMNKVVSGGGV